MAVALVRSLGINAVVLPFFVVVGPFLGIDLEIDLHNKLEKLEEKISELTLNDFFYYLLFLYLTTVAWGLQRHPEVAATTHVGRSPKRCRERYRWRRAHGRSTRASLYSTAIRTATVRTRPR